MKLFLLLAISVLSLVSCHSQLNLQELPRLAWKPIDTVFSCYAEREGDGLFKSGDLLGIELLGAIDKKTGRLIPVKQMDAHYVSSVNTIAKNWMDDRLNGKLRKNAEGYIRADLSRVLPDIPVVVSMYVRGNVAQRDVDTAMARAGRMPEVEQLVFVSKEEAKKKFLENGGPDFSAALDSNPLPASIELTISAAYREADALKRLKDKLELVSPLVISDIMLPKFSPELSEIRGQYLLFRYKT